MKRKNLLLAVSMGIVLVVTLIVWHTTQAQQPERQGAQPRITLAMMVNSYLEGSWAQASFELDVNDENLAKARKLYQKAWNDGKELAEKSQRDREAMRSGIEKIRSELKENLKKILTAEQWQKLSDWEEKTRRLARREAIERPPSLPPEAGQGPPDSEE